MNRIAVAKELMLIAREISADEVLPVLPDFQKMSVQDIGQYIRRTWRSPYFGAKPYIDAMPDINSNGMYMFDPWTEIVAYFLANATTWRGLEAKAVKAELNRRLRMRRMNG